jgi:hypothetical protein
LRFPESPKIEPIVSRLAVEFAARLADLRHVMGVLEVGDDQLVIDHARETKGVVAGSLAPVRAVGLGEIDR